MSALQDLTGRRFGRLCVLHRVPRVAGSKQKPQWVCQCDCGVLRIIDGGSLRRGMSTSCGCFQREDMARRRTTHGNRRLAADAAPGDDVRTHDATYSTWTSMRSRCRNPNAAGYQNYGGRGITVCPQWETFAGFLADMGPRPVGMSLDRIDTNGNYEPGNCRWATHTQQMQNRRTCIPDDVRAAIAEYAGTAIPYDHIARKYNVPRSSVRRILRTALKAQRTTAPMK